VTPVGDLWPEENFFVRSDQYSFARRGIPALLFFSGTHEDYHLPSDEAERVDAEKQARVTRLIFYLGIEVANTTQRPQWGAESYRRFVR